MGLKVPKPPDDYGYGNDCGQCFPAGKTPNYVFARFWDVDACPTYPAAPNGWPFILKQQAIDPCAYIGDLEFRGNLWRCIFTIDVSEIELFIVNPAFDHYFYGRDAACTVVFPVNLDECVHWCGVNGRAIVTVVIDHIIILLTSCYHFVTLPGTLYERWEVGIDHWVYRLANVTDKTNCLFLIDDEDTVPPWDV